MNQEKFLVEIKELRCHADWHRRYYAAIAHKYHRIDYWMRSAIGVLALLGVYLSSNKDWNFLGTCIAGACAVIMANLLPIFKWAEIVSGFSDEEAEWTRIFKGYESIISFAEISDRGEILLQEFQRVKEMQNAAALNDKKLPKDDKLKMKMNEEIREYYSLNEDEK